MVNGQGAEEANMSLQEFSLVSWPRHPTPPGSHLGGGREPSRRIALDATRLWHQRGKPTEPQ